MTTTEISVLPGRNAFVEKWLRTGKKEAILRQIYEVSLPSKFPDYAREVMDSQQFNQWPTQPPTPFTLFDIISLNTQARQQDVLYGPQASQEMQTYGKIGQAVDILASQARKKIAQHERLTELERTAYNLWIWGSEFTRELVVLELDKRIMELPKRILDNEKHVNNVRQKGIHALRQGVPYVARHAISHAAQHILVTAGIIAETAITGGAGIALRFALGQLGLHAARTTLDTVKQSPLKSVVFDKGKPVTITLDGEELKKAYVAFMKQARAEYLSFDMKTGNKRRPKHELVAPEGQQYFVEDALHTAQAVYYNQTPWDFARGPYANWSAAYLGQRLTDWEMDYRELLPQQP